MKKIYSIICLSIMIFVPSISCANIINKLNETGKFTKLSETLAKSGLNKNLESDGPRLFNCKSRQWHVYTYAISTGELRTEFHRTV